MNICDILFVSADAVTGRCYFVVKNTCNFPSQELSTVCHYNIIYNNGACEVLEQNVSTSAGLKWYEKILIF